MRTCAQNYYTFGFGCHNKSEIHFLVPSLWNTSKETKSARRTLFKITKILAESRLMNLNENINLYQENIRICVVFINEKSPPYFR